MRYLTPKKLFLLILIGFFSFSCASRKDVIYLLDVDKNQSETIGSNYTTVFQPDDLLVINVTTPSNKGVEAFNLPIQAVNINTNAATGVQKQITYLVKKDGTIEFPVLGTIKIAGMSMIEAVDYFKKELSEYLVSPIVNIEWVNFKFTVLGDVNKPGQFTSRSERITIFEAIGLAGDLNITGLRNEVTVVREHNGERKMYQLDLRTKDIFQSEAYYIKQNDMIYVAQNKAQVNSSIYNRNAPLYISVASVLISLIAVLSRL
uniref:polysaccharide biosynthesis/export family protein n=2 Tax=Flavobacterium sp. TaxID=239 RepID=UPI00404A55BF